MNALHRHLHKPLRRRLVYNTGHRTAFMGPLSTDGSIRHLHPAALGLNLGPPKNFQLKIWSEIKS